MARYKKHERYQLQPWYIRIGRWCRHIPLAYLTLGWWGIIWIFRGMPRAEWEEADGKMSYSSRKTTWAVTKSCIIGNANINMGWWYTWEECVGSLDESTPIGESDE